MEIKDPRYRKLEAWMRYIHPFAQHGLRTPHLSRQILHTVRSWEFNLVRRILVYRRRAWLSETGEKVVGNSASFNKRVCKQIHEVWIG